MTSQGGHAVIGEWMGERVETLRDLFRPGLAAVCVGINPSPVSVAAAHYYEGRVGQRFFGRLRAVGLLPERIDGFEDDALFARGVGFTDIVKRPTESAGELRPDELQHGRGLLVEKLERYRPGLVIFTFKETARTLLGPFVGNGFLADKYVGGAEVFVIPGPYEAAETAAGTLAALADHLGSSAAKTQGRPRC